MLEVKEKQEKAPCSQKIMNYANILLKLSRLLAKSGMA